MSKLARQFGRPHGLFGRLVGRVMARRNADFIHWCVMEVGKQRNTETTRIVELGPGPGVGLQAILRAFPDAQVWGVDPSPGMLSQSRKRNIQDVTSGRLTLLEGDVASLQALTPVDVVLASHVVYFWHQPENELAAILRALGSGGLLALGFQLRQNMPPVAQKNFPQEGHVLYESDDDLSALLVEAGFKDVRFMVKGPIEAPEGRLALATKP